MLVAISSLSQRALAVNKISHGIESILNDKYFQGNISCTL